MAIGLRSPFIQMFKGENPWNQEQWANYLSIKIPILDTRALDQVASRLLNTVQEAKPLHISGRDLLQICRLSIRFSYAALYY